MSNLFNCISNPVFGIILCLILTGLVVANIINVVITICFFGAWLVTVLWISHSECIKRLSVKWRLLAMLLTIAILGFMSFKGATWVFIQYNEQQRITEDKRIDEFKNKIPKLRTASPGNTMPLQTTKHKKLTRGVINKNIFLYECRPEQWPRTEGLQLNRDTYILLDGKTLKAVFKEGKKDYILLTPSILNNNAEIAITEVNILIIMPKNIWVKQTKHWQLDNQAKRSDYHIRLPDSVHYGIGQRATESLALLFPKVGAYKIEYRITGMAQNFEINKSGYFNIELIEENK